jgi:transcriptional regulator with XRE-family HTH domain
MNVWSLSARQGMREEPADTGIRSTWHPRLRLGHSGDMTNMPLRGQLGAFLRAKRERITPASVGIPHDGRRRTPGLRREEVAQLAGVGVTWYTWLEQGRPINVSSQVLGAVAGTLRLDEAERDHLYRLAEVPRLSAPAPDDSTDAIPHALDAILRTVDPLPAMLVNTRADLLGWNRTYAALHPDLVTAAPGDRNTIRNLFTARAGRSYLSNRDEQAPEVVAAVRYRYSEHLGAPQWQEFIDRLRAESSLFDRLWAHQEVALPRLCDKRYDVPDIGEVRLRATGMEVSDHPGTRLVVYTAVDERSRDRLDHMLRHRSPTPRHGTPSAEAS